MSDGSVEKQAIKLTDTAYKTFLCNKRVGVSTCGGSSIDGKLITGYIEEHISASVSDDSTVEDIAKGFLEYFRQLDSELDTHFIVAGYNEGESKPIVKKVRTAQGSIDTLNEAGAPGAAWDGETEVLTRILTEVNVENANGDGYINLKGYGIAWSYFTLQDAIDFAEYAIDVTIKTMRFQTRPKTVGGPIDILAIKPNGAVWIQRKELHP